MFMIIRLKQLRPKKVVPLTCKKKAYLLNSMNLNIDLFKSDILGLNFAYLVLMSPPLWTLYITKKPLDSSTYKRGPNGNAPNF